MHIHEINSLIPLLIQESGYDIIFIRPLFDETTPLRDIPRAWLQHIEPRVQRMGWEPHVMWVGDFDKNGQTRMYAPGKKGRSRISINKYVMSMFFNMPNDHRILCRSACVQPGCVNPLHIWFGNPRDRMQTLPWLGELQRT